MQSAVLERSPSWRDRCNGFIARQPIKVLTAVVACGLLLVGCYPPGHSQIAVENRTNANVIVAVTLDVGTSNIWVPACGQVVFTFDPQAKSDDPRATHPDAVVVPIQVHGPPDAPIDGTVRITADRVEFTFGVPAGSPPPCSGQPPDSSPSARPS
jgi:hypothetical protein